MDDLTRMLSLDYSHRITTAWMHCFELYGLVRACNPSTTLEVGAGYGVSGVAIGLASGNVDADVVDNFADGTFEPCKTLWEQFGISKMLKVGDSSEFFASNYVVNVKRSYDFIFHDAGHGQAFIPEYTQCWGMTNKVLAIHDVELIDFAGWVAGLTGVSKAWANPDGRGRMLGVVVRG